MIVKCSCDSNGNNACLSCRWIWFSDDWSCAGNIVADSIDDNCGGNNICFADIYACCDDDR